MQSLDLQLNTLENQHAQTPMSFNYPFRNQISNSFMNVQEKQSIYSNSTSNLKRPVTSQSHNSSNYSLPMNNSSNIEKSRQGKISQIQKIINNNSNRNPGEEESLNQYMVHIKQYKFLKDK